MTKELEPLDILLYKGKGFTSWIIEIGTSSSYSHVALVIDPQINLGIESNTGHQSGVRAFDLRKLQMGEVDVYRIKPDFLAKVQKEKAISFLVDHLGAKYDLLGVIGLGLLKILSFITLGLTKKWNNNFQKKRDYFCSELCYEAFNSGGLDIVPAVLEADVTAPGDIAKSKVIQKI
ncbi:MAG: hypothetical protein Q8R48_04795 [Candidatus Omnitrophota bacterium]|nr:hypothetical protein [Candidatus Omnitrophota bacterium]